MNGEKKTLAEKLFEGFRPFLNDGVDPEKIRVICDCQAEYLPTHPVNIVEVADRIGLGVFEAHLEKGISGALDLAENNIYLERLDSVERRRFTCAHEMSHFLFHKDRQELVHFRNSSTDDVEKEANSLAAEILMPTHFVEEFLANNMRFPDLAKKFEVSDRAAKNRVESMKSGD